jgi:hypothetical protein
MDRVDGPRLRPLARGWDLARRVAGYGAAATLSLYLLVKVMWVAMTLLDHSSVDRAMSTAGFVALNAVTIGMAAVGVALGIGLASEWGRRVPSWLLVVVSWVGAGFLVPMLPFMVGSLVMSRAAGSAHDTSSVTGWETAFLTIGFLGMAVGLSIALPIFMRDRWPQAFTGRVGDVPKRSLAHHAGVSFAMVGSIAAGLVWLSRAAGARVGLTAADVLDTSGRLLNASWGLAAVIAAFSSHVVLTRSWGRRLPLWLPTTLAYVMSGSLFAWSSWRLLLGLFQPPNESRLLAFPTHLVCISAGVILLINTWREVESRHC